MDFIGWRKEKTNATTELFIRVERDSARLVHKIGHFLCGPNLDFIAVCSILEPFAILPVFGIYMYLQYFPGYLHYFGARTVHFARSSETRVHVGLVLTLSRVG